MRRTDRPLAATGSAKVHTMVEPVSFEKLVEQRRQVLDAVDVPPAQGQRIWGLALSGGGIRSATFCLGLLKALAQQKMLLRFDLLSTVSGGGYVGATLGRLLSRARSAAEVKQVAEAFGDADGRWFTWWLRANGRYLIPRGAKDTTFALALYLRNLTGVHFELGLLALLLGVVLALFDLLAWGGLGYLGYAYDWFFDAARYVPQWLPAVALLLPVVMLIGTVEASAYWCIPWLTDPALKRWHALSYWGAGIVCALMLRSFHSWLDTVQTDVGASLRTVLWWAAMMLVGAWLFSIPMAAYVLLKAEHEPDARLRADLARNRLTRWIANAWRAGAVVVLIGLVDRFAWFLAFEASPTAQAGAGLALAALAAVVRALLPSIASLLQQRATLPPLLIGRIAGYALTFLLCSWWVSLVHRAALGAAFQRHSPNFGATLVVLAVIGVPVVAYLLLTGRNLKFLNLSSLHAFYWARLARSYLGAANGMRFNGARALGATEELPRPMPVSPTLIAVSDIQRDDDIAFAQYAPQRHGGPIHIVNVCVNQTRDPRGGLFNQDRRGLAMSMASSGHLRVSQEAWQPLPSNALTLGRWTAISGAAIAPGLGSLSRGGISALATFAGLRLGYWWNKDEGSSDSAATTQPSLLAKSVGLLRETFGIFRGTDRAQWFLTDGGHFENTAAYCLLAQRAEIIVLADCGADPQYAFKDLENLVRKARIDLQTEILFQRPKKKPVAAATTQQLTAPASEWPQEMKVFGSLNDLASPTSSCCLALARVDYRGAKDRQAILIVVKPNVSDGLPVDLVNFKAHNPAFPQEATADQFFSEAQWESYYSLGKYLGGKLTREFVERLPEKWSDYFEPDEQSSLETVAAAPKSDAPAPKTDAEKATPASARLPARIGAATAAGALGLGAAATLGVSVWQAIDSYRTASAKQVADERAALKELTDLWAKVLPASSPASGVANIGALAAAIVRTADTLCPANEAGWFQRSVVAETVYQSALKQCASLDKRDQPQPCTALLEAAHPMLQSRLPDCLVPQEGATLAIPPPRYWVFNYAIDAPFARAHPCDPLALERKVADDRYRSGQLKLDAAYGSDPDDIAAATPKECNANATLVAKLTASFTGVREPLDDRLAAIAPPAAAKPAADKAAADKPAADRPALPMPPPPPVSVEAQASKPEVPAASAPTTARPAPAPAAKATGQVCDGRTVYLQIYGPQQRDEARSYREPWRELGASVPPIEDVSASARSAGRAAASPVARPTVRVHDAASRACAQALAEAVGKRDWAVEALSPRLRATPGVIEVWIPPAQKAAY
jgi:patatin-like phospholipase